MKNKLNNYKFVISTGCSYGVVHTSFLPCGGPRYTNTNFDNDWDLNKKFHIKDNVVSISLGLSSSGAKWQSDSIIYATKTLLDLGVKPENIYCFVEWSEWERATTTIPNSLIDRTHLLKILRKQKFAQEHQIFLLDNDKKEVVYKGSEDNESFVNSDIINFLHHTLDIGRLDADITIGSIGNQLYVTASQIPWHIKNWKLKPQDGEPKWDFEQTLEVETHLKVCVEEIAKKEKLYTHEELIESYLNYIYIAQSFLKENNIEYNFTNMNAQLCNFYKTETGNYLWERNNEHVYEYDENNNIKLKDSPSKYIKKENDVENVSLFFKAKMDLLDLDRFIFHNCKRWRRGGIDNYLLDKLGIGIYNRLYNQGGSEILEDRKYHNLPSVSLGNHPNEILYCFVWDKFAKHCKFLQFKKEYIDMVEKKYWEDFNSDRVSEHEITISESYMNKWGLEKF